MSHGRKEYRSRWNEAVEPAHFDGIFGDAIGKRYQNLKPHALDHQRNAGYDENASFGP